MKILITILCFVAFLTIAGCVDSSKELRVVDKVSYENGRVITQVRDPLFVGKFDVILYNQYIKILKYEKDDSVKTYIFPREYILYIEGH